MQTACNISTLPAKSLGSLLAHRHLSARAPLPHEVRAQHRPSSPDFTEEMKTANLPSHTRTCSAGLENACASVTTAQKITPAQTSHLNITPLWRWSETQLLFPKNMSISGGQASTARKTGRNTGERCQMTQCTQCSQNTVSKTFLMPNPAGET